MVRLCRGLGLAVILFETAASGPPPQPSQETNLQPQLNCKFPYHSPVAVRFAPVGPLLAVALQHQPGQDGSMAHILILTRSGELVRPPAVVMGRSTALASCQQRVEIDGTHAPIRTHELLWWSPDGSHVAFSGSKGVTILTATGPAHCDIPLVGESIMPRGFRSGSEFLVEDNNGQQQFYRTDCTSFEVQPDLLPAVPARLSTDREVVSINMVTVLELGVAAAEVAKYEGRGGSLAGTFLGCAVRDRGSGKEILRWEAGKLHQLGIAQFNTSPNRTLPAACALSPGGDLMMVVWNATLKAYRLPAR